MTLERRSASNQSGVKGAGPIVASDLAYFQRINPCGFESSVMTSMAEQLGGAINIAEVRQVLAGELGRALGRSLAVDL